MCLVLWKASSDCAGRFQTWWSVFATRPDGVCDNLLRTCKYVSRPSPTRGSPVYDKRNSRDMRSMTGSLHWVTGGTRPDESLETSQLLRKQSAPLVSEHKRVVQTIKRLRGQPLLSKMCVLVCTDSALHNADADPDEKG